MDIKDTKKLPFILMAISFVMIVSGCVSSFVFNLRSDQQKVRSRMTEVSDSFEEFSTNTSLFEEMRDELYTNVLKSVYYDSLFQDDELIKNKLSNYENMVDELGKQVKLLDKMCEDVYYPESSVNNKCNNYKTIYEQVVNYFVGDIILYNNNIKSYNNYQATNGSNLLLNEL